MKTIYILNFSEDGIGFDAYTNKRALMNGILKSNYIITGIGYSNELIFNYKNLCTTLKNSSKNKVLLENCVLNTGNDSYIHIKELNIMSK
jgi:hypothetical protein